MANVRAITLAAVVLVAGLLPTACAGVDPMQAGDVRPGEEPGSGGNHDVGSAGANASQGGAGVASATMPGTSGSAGEGGASNEHDAAADTGAGGNGGQGGDDSGESGGRGGSGGTHLADAGSAPTCASTGGGKCPVSLSCPNAGNGTITCGCQVETGLGANKKAILEAGASQASSDRSLVEYMLASAMIETIDMTTNYPLGDGKTNDSFNAGVAKQNWGMMRVCHEPWNSLRASGFAASEQMNSDRPLDVQVYVECRKHFGDTWWAGHRNGSAGLQNPNTADIQNFKAGEDWTNQMIQDGAHQCDDVRFWVNLPPK